MQGIPFFDGDYCQFSDCGYLKPTRIWGCSKIANLSPKLCNPNTCPNMVHFGIGRKKHRESLGGNHIRYTPYQKGRFPPALVDYLLCVENPRGGVPVDTPLPNSEIPVKDPGENPMRIAPYALKNRKSYFVGSIAFEEEELQLVMAILAHLQNGEEQILKVLIDTGAQANLVRLGLLPDCILRETQEKLNLRTANGQKLAGGEREADLSL